MTNIQKVWDENFSEFYSAFVVISLPVQYANVQSFRWESPAGDEFKMVWEDGFYFCGSRARMPKEKFLTRINCESCRLWDDIRRDESADFWNELEFRCWGCGKNQSFPQRWEYSSTESRSNRYNIH